MRAEPRARSCRRCATLSHRRLASSDAPAPGSPADGGRTAMRSAASVCARDSHTKTRFRAIEAGWPRHEGQRGRVRPVRRGRNFGPFHLPVCVSVTFLPSHQGCTPQSHHIKHILTPRSPTPTPQHPFPYSVRYTLIPRYTGRERSIITARYTLVRSECLQASCIGTHLTVAAESQPFLALLYELRPPLPL